MQIGRSSDEIRDAIGDLFEGRVGPPYSDEQLETICKEGQERYTLKIPHGYKDEGKDETTLYGLSNYNCRKYGDLLIWRQIIDRATEAKKGIIFVNDDKKEDWWLIFRGKTLGCSTTIIYSGQRQLKFPVSVNYFSRPATIRPSFLPSEVHLCF